MAPECFDFERITLLFKAQERVLDHLACSYEVTNVLKAQTARIIMHIGRKMLLTNANFDAEEIAMDALFMLMAVSAPARHSVATAH